MANTSSSIQSSQPLNDSQGLNYLFSPDESEPIIAALPADWEAFPLGCLAIMAVVVALQVFLRKRRGAKLRVSSYAWMFVFFAAQVVLYLLCRNKMVHADLGVYVTCCIVAATGIVMCILRDLFLDMQIVAEHQKTRVLPTAGLLIRDIAILLAAAVMCMFALELPWNKNVLSVHAPLVLFEFIVILLFLVLFYFLFARHGAGPALVVIACLALGLAQYFVTQFRETPLMPSDLIVAKTAATIAANYTYELRTGAMWALAWSLGALCLMVFICPPRLKGKWHAVRLGICWGCASLIALGMWAYYNTVNIGEAFDVDYDVYQPAVLYDGFCEYGFTPTFAIALQRMTIEPPEGYSENKAKQLQSELAQEGSKLLTQDPGYSQASKQFEAEPPCVVVVMNETFSDFSIFENLHIGYQGPEFFNQRFEDTLMRGPLYVSVRGGGTANTELEFLTNTSMNSVGFGNYPYALSRLDDVHTVVEDFKGLGYATTAIHPYYADNWNRNIVYPAMGFDQFIDIESFKDATTLRGYVTDDATYDKVLELLQDTSAPQFIFDVTVQNHGGYPEGQVSEEYKLDYTLREPELSSSSGELSEYLSLLHASDMFLERFIWKLQDLDRKVVLVFFGDHQPALGEEISNVFFSDEEQNIAHWERYYETVYAIWANYDIAGRPNGDFYGQTPLSTNYLADLSKQAMGAPLEEPSLARLGLRQSIRAANAVGYLAADDQWYSWNDDTSPYAEQALQLRTLEYLNFVSELK